MPGIGQAILANVAITMVSLHLPKASGSPVAAPNMAGITRLPYVDVGSHYRADRTIAPTVGTIELSVLRADPVISISLNKPHLFCFF